MDFRRLFPICALVLFASQQVAHARDLTVATWNLGWHMSQSEAEAWIDKCAQPFALITTSGLWEPSTVGETKPGWELRWGRDAKIKWDIAALAPCNVYQSNFKTVPVTSAAYRKRAQQIAGFIKSELPADVISFQEVSGREAVAEILPDGGADYEICSFTGFKVQRLAIAWRKSLGSGTDCAVETALSLPSIAADSQVRRGLSVTLNIDGKPLRIMTVHLKSACVSPLEDRGKLDGPAEACTILQQQVRPLESWLESRSKDAPVILLGDFNRNLSHERTGIAAAAIRTDGGDPASPLPAGIRVRSLYGEVNDGVPTESALSQLEPECPVNAIAREICARSKRELLDPNALKSLTRADSLGCRNPIGLDHILISSRLASADPAVKVAIGRLGGTRPASQNFPDPLLAVSDHCPLMAKLQVH